MWLLLTAATFLERWITPVTMQLAPPLTLVRQVLRSRERIAVWLQLRLGTQTISISNPVTVAVGPTPGTVVARNKSRSPRRLKGREETFSLTVIHLSHQFGFRDATLWCWKCGGWSAGSRRASRLKDPCGVPTKTGADVVYRVSGGFPPKARVWNSDDTSVDLSVFRSSKTLTATDSGHSSSVKTSTQSDLSLPVSIRLWLWCLGPKHKHHPSTMCTLFDEGSSSSSAETEDSLNIWNSLLAALIHHDVGSALQRCLSDEELGKVALTCHFACDSLCEEMYGMCALQSSHDKLPQYGSPCVSATRCLRPLTDHISI